MDIDPPNPPALMENVAQALSQLHCVQPCLLQGDAHWRSALHAHNLPVLELNDAPPAQAADWLTVALALSAEFFTPVVALADAPLDDCLDHSATTLNALLNAPGNTLIDDADWLRTRHISLAHAVENSPLNQEQRRSHTRRGTIYLGWQTALADDNLLQLAWSSPLPLRRIRDFSARCPQITLRGPDGQDLLREVGLQGIKTEGWCLGV